MERDTVKSFLFLVADSIVNRNQARKFSRCHETDIETNITELIDLTILKARSMNSKQQWRTERPRLSEGIGYRGFLIAWSRNISLVQPTINCLLIHGSLWSLHSYILLVQSGKDYSLLCYYEVISLDFRLYFCQESLNVCCLYLVMCEIADNKKNIKCKEAELFDIHP